MKRSADPNSDKMKAEFRQKLENYKATPSENLWDKIEISLDKEEALVYKNRFRVYSRLAAACLVLLLAFAILFVPRQWEQLKNEKAEMAAVKSDQQRNVKPETTAPDLTDKNSPKSGIPQESIALNTPETEQKETWSQTENLISEPQKTVGVKPQKVPGKAAATIAEYNAKPTLSPEPIAVNVASPETISNAETGFEEVTLATVSPATTEAENAKAETSGTRPQTNETNNVAVARIADENIQPENETNHNQVAKNAVAGSSVSKTAAAAKIMSPEVVSELSQAQTGRVSDQNSNVSEAAATENSLAVTAKKETEIPQVALAVAQEPVKEVKAAVLADKKSGKEKQENAKAGRWKVAASYSALSFSSGIRLAGRTFEPQPAGIGSGNIYNQNISDYQAAIQEYNQETSSAYSQKGSVLVSFKTAKKWLLQTGFSYLQNREQTSSGYVFARNPSNTYPQSAATANSESQTTLQTVLSDSFDPVRSQVMPALEFTTQYSYQYYSLPLNLRFQTDQPGIYYFAGAGGAYNFLDHTTVEIQDDTNARYMALSAAKAQPEKDEQPDVYRKSLISVQLEAGLGYSFSSHWSAEFALTGNRFLKPLLNDGQMNGTKQQNARSFGATLNLGYTF